MESTTINSLLQERVISMPGTDFVKCGTDRWLTYDEVDIRSDRVAAGLSVLGILKGDRVAVSAPTRIEIVELLFACAKMGAILVVLNHWLRGPLLKYQLSDCDPKVLVTDAEGYLLTKDILGSSQPLIMVGLDTVNTEDTDLIPYEVVRQCTTDIVLPAIAADDPQAIIYTSGTTGAAKGCVISHGYALTAARAFLHQGLYQPGDRVFTALVLYHVGGQSGLISTLLCAGSICFEPEFHASSFMERAHEESADVLLAIGTMGNAILTQPARESESTYKFRIGSFAGMSGSIQAQFEERFGLTIAADLYGSTECQPATFSVIGGDRKPGSCGCASPFVEVGLFDHLDYEVVPGEVGEICVRPRTPEAIFSGYWRLPEQTLHAMRNLWYHTGDLARKDSHGYYYFIERKTDSIRRRGENISAREVEAVIEQHPNISEVAVCAVTITSALGDEDVELKASIVCADRSPEEAELYQFLRSQLPYYAVPRFIDVRSRLPRNPHDQKVQKARLRQEGVTVDMWDFEEMGFVTPRRDRRG